MDRREFLTGVAALTFTGCNFPKGVALDSFAKGEWVVVAGVDLQTVAAEWTLWGDGIHDDTEALQALFNGSQVLFRGELIEPKGFLLDGLHFKLSDMLHLENDTERPSYGTTQNCFFAFGDGAGIALGPGEYGGGSNGLIWTTGPIGGKAKA